MMVPHPVAEVSCGNFIEKEEISLLGQANLFVCLLLFVWLMTGLFPKWELSKDPWDRCRVLRVKS